MKERRKEAVGKLAKQNGSLPTLAESPIRFVIARKKRLAELTVDDVPPGLDPEMVASDWPPWRWGGR